MQSSCPETPKSLAESDCIGSKSDLASIPFPSELVGVSGAESIHQAVLRGQIPETHRFLRLLTKLGLNLDVSLSDLSVAEARLFAIPSYMDSLQKASGAPLEVGRTYCALICMLHRRGMLRSCRRAYSLLQSGGRQVPICTLALLIDLCMRDGDGSGAAEYFKEAQTLARTMVDQARTVHPSNEASVSNGCPVTQSLNTDGFPNWISAREGHLLALIAAHAAFLAGIAAFGFVSSSLGLFSGDTKLPGVQEGTLADELLFILRQGLALLDDAVAAGLAGPEVGLGKRLGDARTLLLRPCSQFATDRRQDGPNMEQLSKELATLDSTSLDRSASIDDGFLSSPGLADRVDAIRNVLGLVRSLRKKGRRISREDCDDLFRLLGRRRTTRAGVILAMFQVVQRLAASGSRPLELELREVKDEMKGPQQPHDIMVGSQDPVDESGEEDNQNEDLCVQRSGECLASDGGESCDGSEDGASVASEAPAPVGDDAEETLGSVLQEEGSMNGVAEFLDEPANPHLTPDADMCSFVIEALYSTGGASSAEQLFTWCCAEMLPNPAIYSAVIFGRLAQGNGAGAAAALSEMDAAGFTPHLRFLARFLRRMGAWHSQGLRIIEQLGRGPPSARLWLYHTLMEACSAAADPGTSALEVRQALVSAGLQPQPETHFALLRAVAGLPDVAAAEAERRRLCEKGALVRHPSFEVLLRECYGLSGSKKRASQIMEARRLWVQKALSETSSELINELGEACIELRGRAGPEEESLCPWFLDAYCTVLPLKAAAVHAAQYLAWRFSLVRSKDERAQLQQTLDALAVRSNGAEAATDSTSDGGGVRHGRAREERGCDPRAFALHVILQFRGLEVAENVQVRLLRMLLSAADSAGVEHTAAHTELAENGATELLPSILSELMLKCVNAATGDAALFASEDGRQRLAHLVRHHYFDRSSGEPVKLGICLRFVRAHALAPLLDDDLILRPVLSSFCNGYVQHAFTLCAEDVKIQRRLIAYAIQQGQRRAAGRLAERFAMLSAAAEAPPGWSTPEFLAECAACVREAEDAEAKELRAANAKRADAEADLGCLQMPADIARAIHLVATAEELCDAATLFARTFPSDSKADAKATGGVAPGSVLGLDVEWRPTFEKRGGMQKHRRSSQTYRPEPCATLQVAADNFVIIFDLLALADEEATSGPQLSALVGSLFENERITKLGFGLRNDLQRLAVSYPNLQGFRCIRCALDLQEAWSSAAGTNGSTGLSALCAKHLGMPLSKRLQTSDWGARPLTSEQLLYAALDAHCLIGLARALPEPSAWLHTLEVRQSPSGQLMTSVVRGAGGAAVAADSDSKELPLVDAQIVEKGTEIRAMKASGAPKSAVQAEVAVLLQLKARFRELSGMDWVPSKP